MAYTTIDDPSAYFQTLLYTGNATARSLDNTGNSDLKPDWIWTKKRNEAQNHCVTDSTRGVGNIIFPDASDAESATALVTEFRTNGFGINTNALINDNTDTYVAWQWKANGGTTSSDSNGGITSTVQASTTAGFSITKFDSTSASGQATVGHGLGAIPHVIIMKDLAQTYGWDVHHIKAGSSDADGRLVLNSNEAWNNASNVQAFGVAGSTSSGIAPTSTTFNFNQAFYSSSGDAKIVYCFTPIQGYSKFGTYTGNGSADGTFIYTGFKPAWVMSKETGSTGNWIIHDTTRDPGNGSIKQLKADTDVVEYDTGSDTSRDILSNGFKQRFAGGSQNTSGDTHVYMAFAEQPFVTSTGIPTTAR